MNLELKSMKARHLSKVAGFFFVICIVLVMYAFSSSIEKSQPAVLLINLDPETVLVSLENTTNKQGLQKLRLDMLDAPKNAALAVKYSKRALSIYKTTGDTRYYGYARGALQTWWNDQSPPKDFWLLQARLLQSNHEFRKTITNLKLFLQQYPKNLEAKLLLADALKRVGDIKEAKRACLNIALSNNITWGQLCSVDLLLSLGKYQIALDNIKPHVSKSNHLDSDTAGWALSIAAEAAHASGDLTLAKKYYKQRIEHNMSDVVSLVHYADVLIASHEYDKVLKVLPQTSSSLPVLLRIAIAKYLIGENAQEVISKLSAFLQDPLLGDNQFLYERTLYALYIQNDSDTALALAKQHWAQQKAWEDTELLLTAAKKVGGIAGQNTLDVVKNWRGHW